MSVCDLYFAAKKKNLESVKSLIEKGNDVNAVISGNSLFYWLSIEGNNELIKLLIKNGAHVNVTNPDGITPLHWVSKNGHIDSVKLLLEKGANINVVSKWTPLHWACEKGHIKITKLLIENGANVHATDIDGFTPLYTACLHDHIELAKYLIQHILLKNVNEKKPNFIKEHQDLSVYWNKQIEKINYLPQAELLAGNTLTEDILNNFSRKYGSLLSLSLNQLFNSLNPDVIIKNKASPIDQQSETISP